MSFKKQQRHRTLLVAITGSAIFLLWLIWVQIADPYTQQTDHQDASLDWQQFTQSATKINNSFSNQKDEMREVLHFFSQQIITAASSTSTSTSPAATTTTFTE